MNIVKKEQVFNIQTTWNVKGLEGIRIAPIATSNNYFEYIEINDEFTEFKNKYDNIYKNTVEIKEEDSIYFFKESKYPRFKFNSNCKNNKTINISKAIYAIVPNLTLFSNYAHETFTDVIVCKETGNIFMPSYDQYKKNVNDILEPILKKGDYLNNVVELLRTRLLLPGNYRVTSFITTSRYVTIGKDYIKNIFENIDKCISETNLEKYLSKDSTELTDDIHKQLDMMLQSKDAGTVELGMKMLINFDVDKNALKLGLLIRRHRDILSRNKAATSVGFKNILKQLGINLQDGVPTLNYIDNLYKNTQDEENKALMLDAFRKQLHTHLMESYEGYVRGKNVPTSINIDIN